MKKIGKWVAALALILSLTWIGTVIADRQNLSSNLIRLHVVAASDSQEDQAVKLQIRDAVLQALQNEMDCYCDAQTAKNYLQTQLPKLQEIAQEVLRGEEMDARVTVSLEKEAFPTREYDTFRLPAGVYESLRITVGEGDGKNWWCVVFPSLCIPATSEGFADTAAGAGFEDSLSGALQKDGGYELRFFFLDCFGWLENLLHKD